MLRGWFFTLEVFLLAGEFDRAELFFGQVQFPPAVEFGDGFLQVFFGFVELVQVARIEDADHQF